jgi:hypothetical protein
MENHHQATFYLMNTQQGKRLLEKLAGGDRRSIGRSNEVVAEVLQNPSLFGALFKGLYRDDPLIRIRAADAAEKITARQPEWLKQYKEELLRDIAVSDLQEVRWHVAQMLPRLTLTPAEHSKGYLNDDSIIVKIFAMQALADLAKQDQSLHKEVIALVKSAMKTGTPAMKSRGRKLLKQLDFVDPRLA